MRRASCYQRAVGDENGVRVPAWDTVGSCLRTLRRRAGAGAARRQVHRYTQALSGQLALSAFSFCLNIYLLRALSLADYGVFAFAQVCSQLAGQISGALVATPLLVGLPALAGAVARSRLEALLFTVNAVTIAAFAVLAGAGALVSAVSITATLAFVAFVCATTLRNYARCLAFARQRPLVALKGDLCLCTSAGAAVVLVVIAGGGARLAPVLAALAFANLVTAAWELVMLQAACQLRASRSALRRYRRIWRETRWALLGAATTVLQAQAHSLLVTLAAGPAAFAPLAAGQVLFGPVGVAINALQNVMRPDLAAAIARGDRRGVVVASVISTALLAGGVLVFGATLAAAWPWVSAALYGAKYHAEPMAAIALGCGAIALCRALYTQPSSLLQAQRRFRGLALGTVIGALLSTLGVALCLAVLSPPWTLVGVLAGEAVFAVYVCRRAIAGVCAPW